MIFYKDSYAIYTPYKKFNKLLFKIKKISESAVLHILADSDVILSIDLSEVITTDIDVDISGVCSLKIFLTSEKENSLCEISEIYIE